MKWWSVCGLSIGEFCGHTHGSQKTERAQYSVLTHSIARELPTLEEPPSARTFGSGSRKCRTIVRLSHYVQPPTHQRAAQVGPPRPETEVPCRRWFFQGGRLATLEVGSTLYWAPLRLLRTNGVPQTHRLTPTTLHHFIVSSQLISP